MSTFSALQALEACDLVLNSLTAHMYYLLSIKISSTFAFMVLQISSTGKSLESSPKGFSISSARSSKLAKM